MLSRGCPRAVARASPAPTRPCLRHVHVATRASKARARVLLSRWRFHLGQGCVRALVHVGLAQRKRAGKALKR
eukprot:1158330-Alexandrium_andersonii.AAC.1